MLKRAVQRRHFILGMGALAAAGMVPGKSRASNAEVKERRILQLHNLHTDEFCESCFWANGKYQKGELHKLDLNLRDHRSGEVTTMDRALYEQLYFLQTTLGAEQGFEIISGYRSPASNELLRQNSSGVAKNSYHTRGQAIDIRMPGVALERLHELALSMQAGGVGYYPGSQFIHIDTGPVRSWNG